MRLAVALDLCHFVEPLPFHARLGVLTVDLLPERLDNRKHATVAQVSIVGNGENLTAGGILVGFHPLPQIDGIVAAERFDGR